MSLEVLIVEGEEPVTDALAGALARRGHFVSTARSTERALSLPAQDVIVCEGRLPGACGFDLLSAVQARGDGARFVILLGDPTVDECLRALRLGVSELLAKPFRLEDLVRAVEEGPASRRPRPGTGERVLERSYAASPESIERCALDLCAFALRLGVPPSVRARIAGAAQEIIGSAIRHGGMPATDEIQVRAALEGSSFHLRILLRTRPPDANRGATRGPARTGMSRARALSESIAVRTRPGGGTRVDLAFGTAGADLGGRNSDLSEADFLTPDQSEDLIATLLDGRLPDVEGIPPAIAVVLGRLLVGSGGQHTLP